MTEYITNVIENYGLIAIFLVIALEYACFPVPSELVLPLSGAVAAQGKFNFLAVYLLSILAGLIGSYICYAIVRRAVPGRAAVPDLYLLCRRVGAAKHRAVQRGVRGGHRRVERHPCGAGVPALGELADRDGLL